MALTRLPYWDTRSFHTFLIASARRPFQWGTFDCSLFAGDAIEAITGTDIAAEFRGKYKDEAGGFAAINAICGGATVADAASHCAAKFGLSEWLHKDGRPAPLMARRGDLVVLEDAGRLIGGVVHLNGSCAVSVGATGLKLLGLDTVQRAWRV